VLPDDAKIISVDDHVIEHPRVWLDRVPAKYADLAPRIVKLPDGNDTWLYEGRQSGNFALNAVAGKRREEFSPEPISYDEVAEVLECGIGTVKSRILRGRRALREILEPLLADTNLHGAHAPTSSHGAVAEPQPSPFSDAFTAARRVSFDADRQAVDISLQQSISPRASSTGEGLP